MKAKVWCRDCGEEMQQAPYGILAFYCKKCKLKATVKYEPTPIIKPKQKEGIKNDNTRRNRGFKKRKSKVRSRYEKV